MRRSLLVRLTLIFLALAMGPLLLVGVILIQRSFDAEREQAVYLQQQIAERSAAEIDAFVNDRVAELRLVGGELRGFKPSDRANLLSRLLGTLRSGPHGATFERLALLDKDGREQFRLSRAQVLDPEELRDRAEAVEFLVPKETGATYFGDVWDDAATGNILMTLSLPLYELRSAVLRGVIVADLRLQAIDNLLASLRVEQTQSVYVVDRGGTVVAHREPSYLRRQMPPEYVGGDGVQQGLHMHDAVLAVATIALGGQHLQVIAERSEALALQPAVDMLYTILITTVGAMLVACALGFLIVRQIVRPIQKLSARARAISAGDLSRGVDVSGIDEVAELATAFNHMIEQLRHTLDSQARMVGILEATPDYVGIAGADGRITYINHAGLQMIGRDESDIPGLLTRDMRSPAMTRRIENEALPAVERDGSWRGETSFLAPDGVEIPVSQIIVSHRNAQGEVEYLSTIARDITDQKRVEQALTDERNLLRTILDTAVDFIYAKNAEGQLLMTNLAHARSLGCSSAEELIGKATDEIYASHIYEAFVQDEREILRTGEPMIDKDEQRPNAEGETLWLRTTKVPWRDAQGNIVGIVGITRDIGERKRVEEELERHRNHLEELVAERTSELERAHARLVQQERLSILGQLTATVAHELRNPLGTIRTATYFIAKELQNMQTDKFERPLRLTERNILRCDEIIGKLLDYAREPIPQLEPTPVDTWLAQLLDELEIPDGISCVRELSSGAVVPIDREQLRRAVINVVDNAIHALQDDTAVGDKITVSTSVADDGLAIRITDEGSGIAPDLRDRIFEPLFSTKSFGVGLGMSIVKKIVESHAGNIDIISKPRSGTETLVWLPLESG